MHPVVSALKHHKATVVLMALEIALTCIIVTNALSLIGNRVAAMRVSTGVANNHLVWVRTNGLDLGKDVGTVSRKKSLVATDVVALRSIPGVKSVTTTDGLPLSGGNFGIQVYRRAGDKTSLLDNVDEYQGTRGMLKTLGLKLTEGRDFLPQEYVNYGPFGADQPPRATIITHALAERLWPGEDPLGKPMYLDAIGDQVTHVVGVVQRLLRPHISKPSAAGLNLIMPVKAVKINSMYVLRVTPDARAAVVRMIPKVLRRIDPARTITAHIYTDTIAHYFHGDRAMIWVLDVVTGCLLALTALGVVGLSSFWVQQRARSIGIRRAIGATRRDILRYFQAENFLVVSLGIVVGLAGAVGLNLWLIQHYELHRMSLLWLPAGAVILWLLGQLAVLGPALRAANVPPVTAMRT